MCFASRAWGGSLPRPDLSDGDAGRGSMRLTLDKHGPQPFPSPSPWPPVFSLSLWLPHAVSDRTQRQRDSETARQRETRRDSETAHSLSLHLVVSVKTKYVCTFRVPVKNEKVGPLVQQLRISRSLCVIAPAACPDPRHHLCPLRCV